MCTECNENCAECTNETHDCAVCSDDSVHMPGTTFCVSECPSGYSQVEKECQLVQAQHCFEFTNKDLELTSGYISIASTGSDPSPMYTRGIFFDGDDSLEISDLVLNTEFTLDFWLRPYADPENNGSLLHVTGGIDVLFGLSQNAPGMEYVTTHYSKASLSKEWTHLRYTISKSLLGIYINDVLLTHDNSVFIVEPIIDEAANTHTIGNAYVGFIYKICITQEVTDISDIDPFSDCGPNSCTHCPIDTCISSCDHTQYIDAENETCGDCEPGCETGCLRPTDCHNCVDEKCEQCSDYETCDKCVSIAEKDEEGKCQCPLDTVYSCEKQECGQCNSHCLECLPCELECTSCEIGYYINDSGACSKCHVACATCEDGTTQNCSECTVGFYKFPNTNICRDYCPTKLPNSEQECVEEDQSVCIFFDDMKVMQSDADSGVTIVLDDSVEQPFAVYQRGIYFTSAAEMSLSGLVLNTRFTLEFIIKPETSGNLMTILEKTGSHILTFALTNEALRLQAYDGATIADGNWVETKWHNIAFAVDLTTVRFFVDGSAYEPVETLQSLVIDSLGNKHIVGREYQGFMYTICVHQFQFIDFVTPAYSECELDQTADDPCEDCLDDCTQSCIRTTDCRKCEDPLCDNCPEFEGTCSGNGCIEGARLVDGVCECTSPLFYQIDIDQCAECAEGCETCTATNICPTCVDRYFKDGDICSPCSPNCANCTGPNEDDCSECVEGTYLLPDATACEAACPSGYETDGVQCVPLLPEPDMQEFCFVFTDKLMNQISNGAEIATVDDETQQPMPLLNRGIYFDGEDRMIYKNLVINSVATLDYWIRPKSSGWLMGITLETGSAVFLVVEITPEGAAERLGQDIPIPTEAVPMRVPIFSSMTTQLGIVPILDTWTHLQYRLNNKIIQFFVNGVAAMTVGQVRDTILVDKLEYPHSMGQKYTGFVYSICIRNYAATSNDIDPNPQCSDTECKSCPIGVCLSECEFDELYKDGEPCEDCLDECDDGCIRPTDCRNCMDELCQICSEFSDVCEECVENAKFDPETKLCVCNQGNEFHQDEGKCSGCHDNCTACDEITRACVECSKGYYLVQVETAELTQCLPCNEKCETCQDATNESCATCVDGYSQFPLTQQCEDFCPSGLESIENVCIEDKISICFEFQTKVIELESAGVNLTCESAESEPQPAYSRGMYFDGSTILRAENLVINPRFTLEFWIRPDSVNGQLLTISSEAQSVFIFGLKSAALWYETRDQTITAGEITTQEWVQVAAYTNATDLDLRINNVSVLTSTETLENLFLDIDSDEHRIGVEYLGLIYKICVHQYIPDSLPINLEDCGKGFSEVNPPEACLIDCDFTQWLDETGTCTDCDGCTDVCMRGTDCRNCLEPTCEECPEDYDTCVQCIENASLNDEGECVCAFLYVAEDGTCGNCIDGCCACKDQETCNECCDGYYSNPSRVCVLCAKECAICEDGSNKHCAECAEGYFQIPHTQQCEDYCPTGGNKTPGECDPESSTPICFTFHDKHMPPTTHGVTLLPEGTEERSPIPALDRGYYFDGDDLIYADKLVYNTIFTTAFWHRPTGSGQLFSVNTAEGIAKMALDVVVSGEKGFEYRFVHYGSPIMQVPITME